MTVSREIRDLSPAMQVLHNKFMDRCRRDTELLKDGVTVLVTCTYRDNAEQARLYNQGRTTPGRIVTNARPGKSKHNCTDAQGKPASEAFDVVPLRSGKPVWDSSDPAWQIIGAHAVAVGLKWYGSPGSPFVEHPHMENPQ